jgi:hypothetical protein
MSKIIVAAPVGKPSAAMWMHPDCCAQWFGEKMRDDALRVGLATDQERWYSVMDYTVDEWTVSRRSCPVCRKPLVEKEEIKNA